MITQEQQRRIAAALLTILTEEDLDVPQLLQCLAGAARHSASHSPQNANHRSEVILRAATDCAWIRR